VIDLRLRQSLAGQRQVGLAVLALATVFAGRTAANAKAADSLLKTVNCKEVNSTGRCPATHAKYHEPLGREHRLVETVDLENDTSVARDRCPSGASPWLENHEHERDFRRH